MDQKERKRWTNLIHQDEVEWSVVCVKFEVAGFWHSVIHPA